MSSIGQSTRSNLDGTTNSRNVRTYKPIPSHLFRLVCFPSPFLTPHPPRPSQFLLTIQTRTRARAHTHTRYPNPKPRHRKPQIQPDLLLGALFPRTLLCIITSPFGNNLIDGGLSKLQLIYLTLTSFGTDCFERESGNSVKR